MSYYSKIGIELGGITESLSDKADRDMRNIDTISGADTVIEYQAPTSDSGHQWYRKYASGWVEQGGKFTANDGTNTAVDFLIAMADTNYCFYNGQMSYNQGNAQYVNGWALTTYSTTGFTVHSATNGTNIFSWEVKGMAA